MAVSRRAEAPLIAAWRVAPAHADLAGVSEDERESILRGTRALTDQEEMLAGRAAA